MQSVLDTRWITPFCISFIHASWLHWMIRQPLISRYLQSVRVIEYCWGNIVLCFFTLIWSIMSYYPSKGLETQKVKAGVLLSSPLETYTTTPFFCTSNQGYLLSLTNSSSVMLHFDLFNISTHLRSESIYLFFNFSFNMIFVLKGG